MSRRKRGFGHPLAEIEEGLVGKIFRRTKTVLVVFFIIAASLFLHANYQQINLVSKRVDELTRASQNLIEENHQLRLFAFDLCNNANFLGQYLLKERQNCAGFFPEIAGEIEKEKNIESDFIAATDIFFAYSEENRDTAEQILKISTLAASDEYLTTEQVEKRHENMRRIGEDENINLYLGNFGLRIEKESADLFHLKKEEENLADIYWDNNTNEVKMNILAREHILSLSNFNEIYKRAQYLAANATTFDLEAFLKSANELGENGGEQENILLLGRSGSNLDTIILAAIDHTKKRITLISVPRDLLVKSRKINSFYALFGLPIFEQEIEDLLGRKISHYVMVDMMAFPEVVDKLGGIEYEFTAPLIDPTYRTIDNGTEGTLYFSKGTQKLNGIQALRVARTRHTSSDFARADRQQKILRALKAVIDEQGKTKSLVEIMPILLEKVETDFTLYELLPLALAAKDYEIRTGNVMSTENILASAIIDTPDGKPMYALEPKNNDWRLLKSFVALAVNRD